MTGIGAIQTDMETIEKELLHAEEKHEEYLGVLRDLAKFQAQSKKNVKHLKYLYTQIQCDIKKAEVSKISPNQEELDHLKKLKLRLTEVKFKIDEMKAELPADDNGLYLSIILGSNLDVSLLNPDDRYRYKQEYEKFKMTVTSVAMVVLLLSYFMPSRATDALSTFLMVWYYCTLTIREAILRVNGSRIKGWWVLHHYAACVLCGIVLIWRDGPCYKEFRNLFIVMAFYIALVQMMQYKYQTGCLRRLHALGQRHSMDITVEGFSSWMFKGLTFILPFLVIGYLLQGYCSFYLFHMYFFKNCSQDWQVLALAVLFGIVSLGNIITSVIVFLKKLRQHTSDVSLLASKYRLKTE
ncbi:unnamed protein product [Bursaphelenchus okinawaensis]|uniref:Transmembrane protein 120 homolog n=1 Tax=Bursaphelenchus okinawaensis TaxID=465554 RepID=A0A811KSH4_9BILA|nr:unnamed protein product [Bursaphelenchus okinawaensis]CAG9108529.1 unnamed protein product [Bursaphelenchus okinawaensis]